MKPYYEDKRVTLHHGDCLDVLRSLPDASVDAVVTDPPYGLEFMGKDWDRPWSGRGDKPSGAGMGGGGFTSGNADRPGGAKGNGYAGRETPAYGKPWVAKRCSTCGHTQAGGSPCRCDNPTWVIERQHPAIPMRAFQQWCEQWATECLRVLKPGGHMLAFGGTRTWHRLACAVEDAGFEVRDSIAWMYGSGFPKSLDVSKAIDKAAGAEREVVGPSGRHVGKVTQRLEGLNGSSTFAETPGMGSVITAPATPDAERWQGWGTALKPAFEPVVVARKPLQGTVASNVLAHGTGALNVDGCRIGTEPAFTNRRGGVSIGGLMNDTDGERVTSGGAGRWPANVILDETQAAALDEMSGESVSTFADRPRSSTPRATMAGGQLGGGMTKGGHDDTGGASRFFYVAKADASERPRVNGTAHPTVKPLALMRWLVRLVTPPGGTVLEPFAGSGTTVEACIVEGFHCLAIEKTDEYLPLILARIHRQRDPIAHTRLTGGDLGLFELDGEPA